MTLFQIRFKAIISELNLTYGQIALKMGVARQTIAQLMYYGNPQYESIIKLADAMNIHPSAFFSEEVIMIHKRETSKKGQETSWQSNTQ